MKEFKIMPLDYPSWVETISWGGDAGLWCFSTAHGGGNVLCNSEFSLNKDRELF